MKEFYNEIVKGNISYEQFIDWVTSRETESLEKGFNEGYEEGSNAYSWSDE